LGKEKQVEQELSEKDKLIAEKIILAKQIGIWDVFNPAAGWQDSEQHKRIYEIDQRLAELG
jgi:hypothetical protein